MNNPYFAVFYSKHSIENFDKLYSYSKFSIEQTKLMTFGVELPERILKCHYCGGELEFVMYNGKGPPEIPKIQTELLNFIR